MSNTPSKTEQEQAAAEAKGSVAEENYVQPVAAVREYREAVAQEYGQYVAISAIDFDGARAYNPGDPVPASNVAAYGYVERGLVAKTGTKAAADVPVPVVPGQF